MSGRETVLRRFILQCFKLTCGLLLACGAFVCPAFSEDQTITLQSIRIEPTLEGDTVEIRSDRPFTFVTYTLSQPDRLVIDPLETDVETSLEAESSVSGEMVRSWKIRRPAGSGSSKQVDYLELVLTEPAQHRLESAAGALTVHLRPMEGMILAPTRGETPVVMPPPQGSLVWNLEQAGQFGLGRHRPVRIAREEVELAYAKVREAHRALYPAATLKFSWTTGTASKVDFREYTSGLQLEQPLFYSGRLMEAYRQSLVNLQVAEKRSGKVKADYAVELAQDYFQLIGAKISRRAQEGLSEECRNFLEKGKARFEKKLLTRLEILNIEAQVNQAQFQRANADNDVTLARLKFLQKVSLEPGTSVDVPSEFESYVRQEVDLEEALKLAARYKPEILVNSLLVKFHEYEERIAKAKMKWKVDLSGFLGSSASAFETEPLDSGEDYFIGLKATHAWGPHSTTASMTKTKTSPRLGQTTRTDSTVYSSEMGLFDQLQGLTEIQQAQVNLEKARRDLQESQNAAFQEVEESYISYRKAQLQLEYAEQKIVFREEQVKILKAQASVNEALPSQVLEAIVKLTEEKAGKAQAMGNYYVALAKLNKAIGLPGHYR